MKIRGKFSCKILPWSSPFTYFIQRLMKSRIHNFARSGGTSQFGVSRIEILYSPEVVTFISDKNIGMTGQILSLLFWTLLDFR